MQSLAATTALALLVGLTAPEAAFGSDQQECRKSLAVSGQPSRLRALAQLNAVRAWMQEANAIDERLAHWHHAANNQINCEELPNSTLIRCTAKAKPCPSASLEPSQEAKN